MRAPRSVAAMMLPFLLLTMLPRLARSAQDNDDGGGGDAWLEKGALDPDSGRVCDEDGTVCKLDAHAQLGCECLCLCESPLCSMPRHPLIVPHQSFQGSSRTSSTRCARTTSASTPRAGSPSSWSRSPSSPSSVCCWPPSFSSAAASRPSRRRSRRGEKRRSDVLRLQLPPLRAQTMDDGLCSSAIVRLFLGGNKSLRLGGAKGTTENACGHGKTHVYSRRYRTGHKQQRNNRQKISICRRSSITEKLRFS